MVLEATMVCLDNSEWMRNGDVTPTRMDAQQDAIHLLCNAKLGQNPENTVGLLSLATIGRSPEALAAGSDGAAEAVGASTAATNGTSYGAGGSCKVWITQTQDPGKVLTCLHSVAIEGVLDVLGGLQKAQLALKHRQNKNQRQRIVCFVGSPVVASAEALVRVGRALKKNNVAVDVILFGSEASENEQKMAALVESVNSSDNSHLLVVPAGTQMLAEALMTTPIVLGDEAASVLGASGGDGSGLASMRELGFDPNMDPELAMALRLSLEEEQARQAAAAAAAAASGGSVAEAAPNPGTATNMEVEPSPSAGSASAPDMAAPAASNVTEDNEEMDEEMRLAIEMSKHDYAEDRRGDEHQRPPDDDGHSGK
ncbi:hypothetical protein CDCA_CDCA04G1266 [Cyanidium caldarium]|uniref:VWFA domain-containing protein n=1 Tax=Cyanidium caldarium TaxID=2771 RepID=A0AAV9IT50_CYACA|nr:hypothetical protein CDCA_CDCA04G1266 [Cyanidium caldarium]